MFFDIIIAILVISVIIVVHEFGHFIVAKANGVCVLEFSIGFGPRIFSFRRGDTDYCLKLLFFGGSCRMLGDFDYESGNAPNNVDSEDNNAEDDYDEDEDYELSPFEKRSKEMFKKYGESATLTSKSIAARISIAFAGPLFNFIFAIILSVVFIGINGYDPAIVTVSEQGSAAYEAGLREGDEITSLNGNPIHFAREIAFYETYNESDTLNIKYKRDDKTYSATIVPREETTNSYKIGIKIGDNLRVAEVINDSPAQRSGLNTNDKILSINGEALNESSDLPVLVENAGGNELTFIIERSGLNKEIKITPEIMELTTYETGFYCNGEYLDATPVQTIGYAFCETGFRVTSVITVLGKMFTGQMGFDNISGPVGAVSTIGSVVSDSKEDGSYYVWLNILNITIMLTANLGIMNLFPIPGLDGGRLLLYIIEAARGKPPGRKTEAIVNFIGVIFIMIFMALILIKDIIRLF